MADLNAGLLQIGDLGSQIQMGRKMAQQDQQNLLGSIGSLVGTYGTVKDNEALNNALAKNYDPVTGKLNQQGVVTDMYNYKPQMAQEIGQKYLTQNMANQKAQADINKIGAETGKLGAETGKIVTEQKGIDLKRQLDQNTAMGQLIASVDPNNPASYQKALEYGKSQGFDTSLFEGIDPNNPEQIAGAKRQAMGYLIQANDQVKNAIDQQNANSTAFTAQSNAQIGAQNANSTALTALSNAQIGAQNANSNTMNALTNQQRAGQDYEVNTNKNNIDMYKANIDAGKARAEIAQKGQLTPQQQLDYNKAGNDLNFKKIEESNKIRDKVSSLNYTNNLLSGFSDNAKRLLDSPLFTAGKDPKTGDYLRDNTGKIIPSDNNTGGVLGTAIRKWAPGTNQYKEAQREFDTLVGIAKGKTMAEFKSAIGSTGTVTDADAKNFAAMQSLPESFDDFVKLSPQQQVDALDKINTTVQSSLKTNNDLIAKYQKQSELIDKQQINAPQLPNSGQAVNKLYNNGQPVNLPTSMPNYNQAPEVPPLRDQVYRAPNGYVLTPAMYNKILKAQQGQ